MILFLAGTSDARELAILLKKEGFPLIATVVTESAAKRLTDEGMNVRVGRLNEEKMFEFSKKNGVTAIVDASHPFAEEAHKTAKSVAEQLKIPYIRYEREQIKARTRLYYLCFNLRRSSGTRSKEKRSCHVNNRQ